MATVVSAGHGMADGDPVLIAGANDIEYNGTHQVNYIDADTFSFHVESFPGNACNRNDYMHRLYLVLFQADQAR